MLISLNWIKQFTNIKDIEPQKLAYRLSASLAEVESFHAYNNEYKGIVIGRIIKIDLHPNSDKLQLTTVDIGAETPLSIVCGAQNIKINDFVPVATIGTELEQVDHNQKEKIIIQKRSIRDIESEGMLCSPRELGISDDSSGILILNNEPEVKAGMKFSELFETNDVIWEIENKALTHRPDTFSQIGMAREIATMLGVEFNNPEYKKSESKNQKLELKISIENPQLCRRYSAVVLKDVTIKPSPLWIQSRLIKMKVRPINNIVDITNYVMLEQGQPLHAFDKAKLTGNSIIIRTAKKDEKLITLDGKERTLTQDMLVIADEDKAIALAGIMGGKDTEINETTTDIILESANFEHFNNRKTSRQLGLQTEASLRFSKNQDPEQTIPSLYQAIDLIQQYAGGELVNDVRDEYPTLRTQPSLSLTIQYLIDKIGDPQAMNEKEIKEIYRSLGFTIEDSGAQELTITPPTFRPDITIKEDLVEEIARIKGYDNLTPTLPTRDLNPAVANDFVMWKRRVKNELAQIGLSEVYNYSFVGKELYEKCGIGEDLKIKLRNPISPEREYMRPYLLPQLIENVAHNQKLFDTISLFELERGITPEGTLKNSAHETTRIALASFINGADESYFPIKGMVEQLIESLHLPNLTFITMQPPETITQLFDPNRASQVMSGEEIIGYIGELHPQIQTAFGLDTSVGIAELDADLLYKLTDQEQSYIPASLHPKITIDTSFVIEKELSLDTIILTLQEKVSNLVIHIEAFESTYDKEKFGEDKKAATIRMTFQALDQSLSKEDTLEDNKTVKEILTSSFSAEIR